MKREHAQQRLLKAVTACIVLRKMGAITGFNSSLADVNKRLDAPTRILNVAARVYENIAQGGSGVFDLPQLTESTRRYWRQSWRKEATTCQKRKRQTPTRAVALS